jgi:isopenicillin N synthase-like dioxygenase
MSLPRIDSTMSTVGIPIIDIAAWSGGSEAQKDRVAAQFADACRSWGFVLIAGHGVGEDLIERMQAVTRSFFDLPADAKALVDSRSTPGIGGYYPFRSKSHARTLGDAKAAGDLRESFMAAVSTEESNPWPRDPAEMRHVWSEYVAACRRVTAELMRISARALSLPDDWFDEMIDRPMATLAAQHYPALDGVAEPGALRSGAHTDFGTLTLLLAEDRPGGLQIQGTDGAWHDLAPVPGTFIINLGDMMARWTNDRWRSTLHRVVVPPAGAGAAARRLSIVYFLDPNADALIECIPSCTDANDPPHYAPILAGEHVKEKLRLTNSVVK